jgi:hypothetical protein
MPDNSIPDTGLYLVLGLVATFTILVAFLASMVVRFRNLRQDLQLLEELREEQQS